MRTATGRRRSLRAPVSHTTHALALALSASCTVAPQPDARIDPDKDRIALDSLWTRLGSAMIAGDTAAVAALYTDSAWFAETGVPTLRGRAAILSATASVFECCRYVESTAQAEITDLAAGFAHQFGTYRDVIQPDGDPPLALYGRFSAALLHDAANGWRIHRLLVVRDSSLPLPADPR